MELLLLITICLLTGQTLGDDPVKMIFKAGDQDVLLSCSFRGDLRDKKVVWIKDGKEMYVFGNGKVDPSLVDEQFRDRISHFQDELQSGNASIKIMNSKISDIGIYSCLFYDGIAPGGLWKIELTVGYVGIIEGEDAILPCHYGTDLTHKKFDWKKDGTDILLYDNTRVTPSTDEQLKGRVSHFPDELQSGNASIKIEKAKMSDSGNYTCIRINQSGDKVSELHIELVVDCNLKNRLGEGCDNCPQPSFSVLGTRDTGRQVECRAVGAFPQPKMELRNDADVTLKPEVYNVTPNGSYFDIILIAFVTEEGYYRCLLTQQDICHQISSKKSLVTMPSGPEPISTTNPMPLIVALIVALIFILILACVVVKLRKYKCPKCSGGGSTAGQTRSSEEMHPATETQLVYFFSPEP